VTTLEAQALLAEYALDYQMIGNRHLRITARVLSGDARELSERFLESQLVEKTAWFYHHSERLEFVHVHFFEGVDPEAAREVVRSVREVAWDSEDEFPVSIDVDVPNEEMGKWVERLNEHEAIESAQVSHWCT